MDRKIGVVQISSQRGFSILRVGPESSLERYYLHVSKIRSGTALPLKGMTVIFDVLDKPVKEGQLPQAVRADVILPDNELPKDTSSSERNGGAQ
jgi:hypothetical protein